MVGLFVAGGNLNNASMPFVQPKGRLVEGKVGCTRGPVGIGESLKVRDQYHADGCITSSRGRNGHG